MAENYLTGKVTDLTKVSAGYGSFENLDSEIIHNIYVKGVVKEGGILGDAKQANGYYTLRNGTEGVLVRYDDPTVMLHRVEKQFAYGIKPRNTEQSFALDSLLNEEIKLVAIQGVAGTGKHF